MKLKRADGVTGTLLLTDVEDGIHTPLRAPGTPPPRYGQSRQAVYVPEYDAESATYPELELVDTDRVILSRVQGCIYAFEDEGLITVTEEPVGPTG